MHIFGILRLWEFQNTQFHLKVKETFCLMTLYRFFYYINSKFLLHKDFFSHHKHCSRWSLCIIKFIFQAKIRPKILAIFAKKWVFAAKWLFDLEINRWSLQQNCMFSQNKGGKKMDFCLVRGSNLELLTNFCHFCHFSH